MASFSNYVQPTGVYQPNQQPNQMQTDAAYPAAQPQQMPAYQCQPQQQPAQSTAIPGGNNAVNINIYSPTANSAPATYPVAMPYYYPVASHYGNYAPPANYPENYNNSIKNMSAISNDMAVSSPMEKTSKVEKTDKKDDKNKTKVLLSDNYLKSLENYLASDNPKIRLSAVKEILERFKEDEKRRTDPALTALLNKALQDPSPTVRFMALTTLDVGYAQGNTKTAEILKQLQQLPDSQGEDALLASQVLLKMSGQKVDVPKGA